MMYDIAIVGAGPAGSTLARLIGRQYKVLLIDKRDLGNEKPLRSQSKCCGGLLAPDAQKMIAKLGLAIPKDILVNPQIFAVRTLDLTNHLERLYQRHYLNMDRERFDRWLISMLPMEVDQRFDALFKNFIEIPEGYELQYMYKGQEVKARTKILVGADGAFSRLRKLVCGEDDSPEKYVSIQEWYECSDPMPYFTSVFDEEISDFYSWVIPKEGYLLLGAALKPQEDTWERYLRLKTKLTKLGFRFDHKIKTEGAYIYRTKKGSQLWAGKDRIAFIGEAAGAISPSSAEGISYALKSALYLSQSLEEGIDGFMERYHQQMKGIRRNILIKNLKSPAMYNPFLRKLAMKSGLQSMDK